MLGNFSQLAAVNRNGTVVRRSASNIGGRPLVLFHKQGNSLTTDVKCDWTELLSGLGCGPVIELDAQNWPWSYHCPVNFNCHAMAIGSGIGLTPEDWLEGIASPATLGQNPTVLLLHQYYHLLQVDAAASSIDFQSYQQDDVVACYDSRESHFVHSGIVKVVDGRMVVVSKFGEGPILITSLELIQQFYAGKFDEIRWYRFDGLRKTKPVSKVTSGAQVLRADLEHRVLGPTRAAKTIVKHRAIRPNQ